MSSVQTDILLRSAAARLSTAGVASPNTDARLLLAHAWGCEFKDIALHALRGTEVAAVVAEQFAELLARREVREPLQHITGQAHFRYLDLAVGPGVFIPRPETELLVDCVLERLQHAPTPRPRILDLCTGSGALALALATEVQDSQVVGVEISEAALSYAGRNLAALEPQIAAAGSTCEVIAADVCELPALGRFDIVVANPPYVPESAQPEIPEVTDHDPATALYGGGADGMDFPRLVIAQAARVLVPGGFVVIEHAETQAASIGDELAAHGFTAAVTRADYTGRDRFTFAELEPEDT